MKTYIWIITLILAGMYHSAVIYTMRGKEARCRYADSNNPGPDCTERPTYWQTFVRIHELELPFQ